MDGVELTPEEEDRAWEWITSLPIKISAKSLSDALSARMEVIGDEMTETKVHFDPVEHPRHPKGTEHGGEFMDVAGAARCCARRSLR